MSRAVGRLWFGIIKRGKASSRLNERRCLALSARLRFWLSIWRFDLFQVNLKLGSPETIYVENCSASSCFQFGRIEDVFVFTLREVDLIVLHKLLSAA